MKGFTVVDKNSENNLNGFDIEGSINKHYERMNANGSPFSGNASVTPPQPAPVQNPSGPIIGGHEDHDHAPLVVQGPYVIIQYTQTPEGENAFSLNVDGINGGILGAIAQIKETVAHLEGEIAKGNIAVN